MKNLLRRILFFLFAFCTLPGVGNAQLDTVQIENGLVAGVSDSSGATAFKGIPYAAAPVGDLRWRAPQPPPDWEDAYSADEFAPVCMQIPPPEGSFYQVEFYQEPEPTSEDCLYLNIWTAAKFSEEHRPVMMWIHGGAFNQGSGSMPTFNGEAFAKKGVVLVTINYRLGIFGLFAHPELTKESEHNISGNYGLLDQVAALKWIQKNIAAFGGDPNNVTVFGQSSGAGNINKLMGSPLTKNLFHRAVLQSGSAYTFGRTASLEQMEERGEKFTNEYKISSFEQLRRWSPDTLLEKGRNIPVAPNIDGWFLPEETHLIFEKGSQHDVPILAGSVADEGNTFFGPKFNAEIFRNIAKRSYSDRDADAFLNLYPHQTDAKARESYNKSWSHNMAWGAHTLAKIHSKTIGADSYLYYFSKVPPGRNSDRYGAFHSAEIAYLFNTLDAVGRPWTKEDRLLADKIISYWVNFAATGNPNDNGLPNWPEYDANKRRVLELGDLITPSVVLQQDILEFYNTQFQKETDQ
jgi:para-nitrobenzyl esterase